MQTSDYADALRAIKPDSPVLAAFEAENLRDRIRNARGKAARAASRWRRFGVRLDLLESLDAEAEACALELVLEEQAQ